MTEQAVESATPPAAAAVPQGWGLHPEPGAPYHWSARAILEHDYVDVVWDRCGYIHS
jgi:hypothetical protein